MWKKRQVFGKEKAKFGKMGVEDSILPPSLQEIFGEKSGGEGGLQRISPSDSITQILFRYLPPPNKIQDSFLSITSDG